MDRDNFAETKRKNRAEKLKKDIEKWQVIKMTEDKEKRKIEMED